MGTKYQHWKARFVKEPRTLDELVSVLFTNRRFEKIEKLEYGDHGLEAALAAVTTAIRENKRIALYADYDVDGTMSCVSWIWFLRAIGYSNFTHYIPCRHREGYGVNLTAVKKLVEEEKAELIITMDTGITANEEAKYCREKGVTFLCTDHHKIQPEKMPDCIVLNPKMHPNLFHQEMCGCGITFVLLRKLAREFPVPNELWTDLLAITGMATICDVVPLNPVNHRLAQLGVESLLKSKRQVLRLLCQKNQNKGISEREVGFRLGPRINAVGRLEHADTVIKAFVDENPEPLIAIMEECNDRRKQIQAKIVEEAKAQANDYKDSPILFMGGDWHHGVVGIAATRMVENFWRPAFLFHRGTEISKGSARSILGFDVVDALTSAKELFIKFGGHRAAGGFTFETKNETLIRERLTEFAENRRREQPDIFESRVEYDVELPWKLLRPDLADALDALKPFGNGFEPPLFRVSGKVASVDYYSDKTTGERRHTAIHLENEKGVRLKLMAFSEVLEIENGARYTALVEIERNEFAGKKGLTLIQRDFKSLSSEE